MKYLLLITVLSACPLVLSAQELRGDSLLAHERAIDRPITLHRGQFRFTGNYGLGFLTRRYNAHGESVALKEDGIANSLRHRLSADIRYGISEFIQITTAIGYSSNTVRQKTDYIVPSGPAPIVSHDVTKRYTGLEDLYVGLDLRAPLKTRKVDIAAILGLVLPVSPFKPERPQHSYDAGTGTEDVNRYVYRYDYPRGAGVAVAKLGSMIKYRMKQWAFSGRVDYAHGLKEAHSVEWRHQLSNDGTFDYRQDPFTYRLADSFTYYGEIEYQARRRLDIFLNVAGHTAYRGWRSTQDNLKVATPYQSSWIVTPGAEILLTPKLWLRERINFSLAGRSYEAPFSFETSLLYNVFPF